MGMALQALQEKPNAPARPRVQVLIIEDDSAHAELIGRAIERGGIQIRSERVQSTTEIETALDSNTWDIVIADWLLPNLDSQAIFRILNRRGLDIPVIVVSAFGEEFIADAHQAGAKDALEKAHLEYLPYIVRRELKCSQDLQELVKLRAEREQREQITDLLRTATAAIKESRNAPRESTRPGVWGVISDHPMITSALILLLAALVAYLLLRGVNVGPVEGVGTIELPSVNGAKP